MKSYAKIAYDAYWPDVKPEIKEGWEAAASAVMECPGCQTTITLDKGLISSGYWK